MPLRCNSNVPDIGTAPTLAVVTFGRHDPSFSAFAAIIADLGRGLLLKVALPIELLKYGPFIHRDAARHAILICSGPAILVPIAKATS